MLGPNGAGKTTLLSSPPATCTRPAAPSTILGETLGAVDVFELRPRIGLASAAHGRAAAAPADRAATTVLTASYGMAGHWREVYEHVDEARARALLAGSAWRDLATARSARCPRASASGCRSPAH